MEVAYGLNIPLAQQTLWFLASVPLGAAVALFYTLFRAVTHRLPRKSVGTAMGDLVFCLAVGAAEFVFILMLPANSFRWFHFAGQLLGAVLLRVSVGRALFRAVDRAFQAVLRLLLAAVRSAKKAAAGAGRFFRRPKGRAKVKK